MLPTAALNGQRPAAITLSRSPSNVGMGSTLCHVTPLLLVEIMQSFSPRGNASDSNSLPLCAQRGHAGHYIAFRIFKLEIFTFNNLKTAKISSCVALPATYF